MIEINKKNIRVWSMLGMRRMIGPIMEDIVCYHDNIIFSTADLGRYFAYEGLLAKYPEHVVNFGIAEQNLIGASAALQKEGFNVFASTYATFITSRVLDQIRVNVGIMGFGIKLVGGAGGISDGNFSATHMAIEDIANLRTIPNITIICPADGMELVKTLLWMADFDGPVYVRLTGRANMPIINKVDYNFEVGKAIVCREGTDVAIVSNGTILGEVLAAAELLAENGIDCKVINMHTLKPLDKEMLFSIQNMKLVVTVEEHMKTGGLGGAMAEFYAEQSSHPRMLLLGIEGAYPDPGEYEELLIECGLKAESIADRIEEVLNQ